LLAAFVYVAFRSKNPDEATVKEVQKILKDNNIDIKQLVEITTNHCQEAETSIATESST
jgi:hypothetical protein